LLAKRKSLRFYAHGGPDKMSESGPFKGLRLSCLFPDAHPPSDIALIVECD